MLTESLSKENRKIIKTSVIRSQWINERKHNLWFYLIIPEMLKLYIAAAQQILAVAVTIFLLPLQNRIWNSRLHWSLFTEELKPGKWNQWK